MAFPQTPSHSLPGAFLHTPAVASRYSAQQDPVRRRLFQPGSNPNAQAAGTFSRNQGLGLNAPTQAGEEQAARGLQNQNIPPMPPMPPLPPLAKASFYINNALAKDGEYPQLDSYCRRE